MCTVSELLQLGVPRYQAHYSMSMDRHLSRTDSIMEVKLSDIEYYVDREPMY